jgi:16S rRNA (cytosine1402-N4)-methyltransferase
LAIASIVQPEGRLIGFDQDAWALAHRAGPRLEGLPVSLIQANFSEMETFLKERDALPVTGGILLDIGVSSFQLDQAERGFSFSKEAPLDMRMNAEGSLTAAIILNEWSEAELLRIFSEYGEERFSRTIAREIVQQRKLKPFETTLDLAHLVVGIYERHKAWPPRGNERKSKPIHPATQVFQAIRIAVNDELGHLERFLNRAPSLLAPGARLAIISFHSLEDRIVKQAFKNFAQGCQCPAWFPVCQCGLRPTLKILTGKPVTASEEEIRQNPRSRSARLRVAERLPESS